MMFFFIYFLNAVLCQNFWPPCLKYKNLLLILENLPVNLNHSTLLLMCISRKHVRICYIIMKKLPEGFFFSPLIGYFWLCKIVPLKYSSLRQYLVYFIYFFAHSKIALSKYKLMLSIIYWLFMDVTTCRWCWLQLFVISPLFVSLQPLHLLPWCTAAAPATLK